MADNDYKELIGFVGKQFEGIDKRFDAIERRLDNTATKEYIAATREEIMRHTGVLIEAVEHKVDIVIESVMSVNEKLDRRTEENEREHARLEKMALINTADISKLYQRVTKLEGNV